MKSSFAKAPTTFESDCKITVGKVFLQGIFQRGPRKQNKTKQNKHHRQSSSIVSISISSVAPWKESKENRAYPSKGIGDPYLNPNVRIILCKS